MTQFDSILIVDWSGGNDRGPTPKKDSIWACVASADNVEAPVYLRNRQMAEAWIGDRITAELEAGRRVLVGFDFPFGFPTGFAEKITGSRDPLQLWDWLEKRILDTPETNNRFDLAGQINAQFPGVGPFWANGLKRDIDHLPRTCRGRDMATVGLAEKREVDEEMPGAFTCWQLAGAGAVGSQVMMGLPVLARLRRQLAESVAVWPLEPVEDIPIVLAEVFPSLLADEVRAECQAHPEEIRDAVQVRLLASALSELQRSGGLAEILGDVPARDAVSEEAWVLGASHVAQLRQAARAALNPDLIPPRLKNDCFAMPQGVDWTPVDTALAHLRAQLSPVTGVETVATGEALGRILAKDHFAMRANPPAANSAVDGYGFLGRATGSGRQVLPLLSGRAAAGEPFRRTVPEGHAIRILTGALLPDGVDTVVLEEDVVVAEGRVAFDGPIKTGANTRKKGEDVAEGARALGCGRVVTPADLALLSALGVSHVRARARLRVGVLSTGDEIVPAAKGVPADKTFDANRPMLLGLAKTWGYEAVDLGHVADNRAMLRDSLTRAARLVDVILTSGGASAGDEDHVSALLKETGALETWRVAIKPGRPLALGLWDGVPVFGLPGNPVAAMVCTLVFGRPAFSQLAGGDWQSPTGFQVPAAFAKRKKPGRREYLRARVNSEGAVEVFASEGSGRVSGLSWADGLVELGDDGQEIRPGDPVTYYPYGSFGL